MSSESKKREKTQEPLKAYSILACFFSLVFFGLAVAAQFQDASEDLAYLSIGFSFFLHVCVFQSLAKAFARLRKLDAALSELVGELKTSVEQIENDD